MTISALNIYSILSILFITSLLFVSHDFKSLHKSIYIVQLVTQLCSIQVSKTGNKAVLFKKLLELFIILLFSQIIL